MKKLFISFVALISGVFVFGAFGIFGAFTAFAENDAGCSGRIEGQIIQPNANVGLMTFDAHYGPGSPAAFSVYGQATDLSIVNVATPGLAPGSRDNAACITDDEKNVKGYGWLNNGGFISFFCDGKGGSCGNYAYGVKVGAKDGSGNRYLSGEAWNEVFGYIKFNNGVANGDVYADSSGLLHGYAWTDGKVWIDFNNVRFFFPSDQGVVVPPSGPGPCDNKPFDCFEVTLTGSGDGGGGDGGGGDGGSGDGGSGDGGDVDDGANPPPKKGVTLEGALGLWKGMAIADGVEGYEIHLYMKESDGTTPMDLANYTFGKIKFNWTDTVKPEQVAGKDIEANNNTDSEPWKNKKGAVLYKPVEVTFENDFKLIAPGHYVLKNPIRSYAPTTNANLSMTSGFTPNVLFNNEFFFTDLADKDGDIWTLPANIKPNNLILHSIAFELKTKDKDGKWVPISYNGKPWPSVTFADSDQIDYAFKFRPAVYLSTLYADDLQDTIDGFRGIPFNLKAAAKQIGGLTVSASIRLILDFDKTTMQDVCTGSEFEMKFKEDDEVAVAETEKTLEKGDFDKEILLVAIADLKKPELEAGTDATAGNAEGDPGDSSSEEKLPEEPGCLVVQGPTVYSIVKYAIDGREVAYYSNKLPRVATAIGNPDVVVHGNIYAPKAFTPTHQTQTTGNIGIDLIRNSINENLARQLGDDEPKASGKCTIKRLDDEATVDCSGTDGFEALDIGEEKVLYFKDTDVVFDLAKSGGKSQWDNKWAVVVKAGKVFFDGDVYGGEVSDERKLAIVSLRPFNEECDENSVYIDAGVKNLQMNLVSDCPVYSYADGLDFDALGAPVWVDLNTRSQALIVNQLLIQGSIMSRNTIGGADNPEYAFSGFGEVFKYPLDDETRIYVQNQDWNYMRLGKGELKYDAESGLPIDQTCGKALDVEDLIKIKGKTEVVVGDKVDMVFEEKIPCNGIDPTQIYDAESGFGDLMPKISGTALGLDSAKDLYPIYIFYVSPTSDSFVFKKAGGLQ